MESINRTKIVAAFDDQHFSHGVMDYLLLLDRVQPIRVAGLFLPRKELQDLWGFMESGMARTPLLHPLSESETVVRRENVATFRKLLKEDIPFRIHDDFTDLGINETVIETRFADLLVAGSEAFFEDGADGGLGRQLKATLGKSECPVVLVPEHVEFPGSNILAYDGTPSSVFAIKQYAYLFPQWCQNPTWLVFASSETRTLPDETFIKELTAEHFPDITYSVLPTGTRRYFTEWLGEKKGGMLVCGGFGRSPISENIRRSFVTEAIEAHQMPVFLAHR